SVNLSADALVANDFVVNGDREKHYREGRLSLDAPLKFGRQTIAAHGDLRLVDRGSDNRTLNALGRLSTNINGFNLTTLVEWQRRLGNSASLNADRLEVGLLGTGHVKNVRLRGEARWEMQP